MMGATGASSSIASQRASPWPGQISGWCYCKNKSYNFLPCYQKSQMKLDALPRLRYCFKDKTARIRTERFSFIRVPVGSLQTGRLGLVSSRSVVRAQKVDKEDQKLDKVEKKSTESWVSSIQRANTVSRIFVATLVWICLFLWISIMYSEAGGGRPGRRGPRK